jgi:hypothetical protein
MKVYFLSLPRGYAAVWFSCCAYAAVLQVAALQTEAVLDVLTDEWVVNTPDEGAIKWWIGNAAEDGRAATVFARLKVPAQDGERS